MASHDPPAEAAAPAAVPGRTVVVLGAAVVSGIAGYVVLVLTARFLDPVENADFLVFWGALFGVFGVLIGISSETTRAVFAARGSAEPLADRRARIIPVSAAIGLLTVVVLGLSGLWWAEHLFGERWQVLLPVMLVGVALFSLHCGVAGTLAGRSEWGRYATLVAAEPTVRVTAVALVAATTASVGGFAAASSLAAGTWVVFVLVSRRYRSVLDARADVVLRPYLGNVARTCSAAAASALLLVGFPVLLRLTTPDETFSGAAPLILAVSLSRAPLLVPLGAYQSIAVTKVMSGGLASLRVPALVVAAATAVGVVLAYLLGPAILRLLNPDYDVAGSTFSLLVVAAGLISLLTLTGAASLALDRHTAYAVGWVGATAVAAAILAMPLSMDTRVVAALVVAPLVGMPLHLVRLPGRRG